MIDPSETETILAGGGVLYKKSDDGRLLVALIYRRNVWDLPKGKLDEDESIEACAVREIQEELGIYDVTLGEHITDTLHYYKEKGQRIEKYTAWFLMTTEVNDSDLVPELEEDIEEARFVEYEEAMEMVGFDNLRSVLSRAWPMIKGRG